MSSRLTLTVAQGASRDFLLQVASSSASAPWSDTNPSPFLSSDVLSAVIWAGQDQPTLFTLVPTWVDVAAATYLVSLNNATTTTMAAGIYRMQVTATRAGRSAVVFNGRLQVRQSAGAGAAIPVYNTLQDLLLYCSWIQDLQADQDDAGFLQQRGRARSWMDDAIVDRFRFRSMVPMLGDPGTFPYYMGLPADTLPTKFFRDILAANTGVGGIPALIITPTAREAVSKMTIHYILADEIAHNPETPYQQLAGSFARSAVSALKALRAEVDTNGDGLGDYIVNMSTTDLR